MDRRFLGEVLVTLTVIMDPPGAVPVFLAVTAALNRRDRARAALIAVLTAFTVIIGFALGGRQVLRYLRVSVPALQCSGGLLLLVVALQLLHGRSDTTDEVAPEAITSIGMVPLGTPLLAGPGAIVATIVFVNRADSGGRWAALLLGILGTHVILYLAMRFSELIRRLIRDAGILLVTRVAGMLVAAIAVQMMADGVRAFVEQG
jgi:multiple antibiotic resistance protein